MLGLIMDLACHATPTEASKSNLGNHSCLNLYQSVLYNASVEPSLVNMFSATLSAKKPPKN